MELALYGMALLDLALSDLALLHLALLHLKLPDLALLYLDRLNLQDRDILYFGYILMETIALSIQLKHLLSAVLFLVALVNSIQNTLDISVELRCLTAFFLDYLAYFSWTKFFFRLI